MTRHQQSPTLLLILALVLCAPLAAYKPEMPDPVYEDWRWESYPQLQGPSFRAVAEDVTGAVWFGTDKGVKRYDGRTWTEYTETDGLFGAPINVLCPASVGRVYAVSRLGISVFEDGAWRRIFPASPDVNWTIWSIREMSDRAIWSGMSGDQIAREIRLSDPTVVTFLITGWDIHVEDDRLSEFDFHLKKPLVIGELNATLVRAISLRDRRLREKSSQSA